MATAAEKKQELAKQGQQQASNKTQTQIRLPENLYLEIKQEAEELGVSLNAHLIELLWLGKKARDSFPIIPNAEHQPCHKSSRTP